MKRLGACLRFRRRALHQQQGQTRNPGKGSIAAHHRGLRAELQATGCLESIGSAAHWRRDMRSPVAFLRQVGINITTAAGWLRLNRCTGPWIRASITAMPRRLSSAERRLFIGWSVMSAPAALATIPHFPPNPVLRAGRNAEIRRRATVWPHERIGSSQAVYWASTSRNQGHVADGRRVGSRVRKPGSWWLNRKEITRLCQQSWGHAKNCGALFSD